MTPSQEVAQQLGPLLPNTPVRAVGQAKLEQLEQKALQSSGQNNAAFANSLGLTLNVL